MSGPDDGRTSSHFAAGAVAGAVSALPGASGSTMLVIFGVYERLLRDISGFKRLRSDLRFILVLVLGLTVGLFLCTGLLDFALERWETAAMFFFAALIICQIPDVKAIEGREGPAGASWWATFAAGFAAIVLMATLEPREPLEPSVPLMATIGAIFVAAKILPGISGSTVLMAMGMYPAFLDAISELDFAYLLPMAAGGVLALVFLAKAVWSCLKNHRTGTFGLIMGLTVGSVVVVLFQAVGSLDGIDDVPSAIIGILAGLAAGLVMRRLARSSREGSTAAGIGIRRD